MGEIQQFRGNERRWCQRCTDYFATHKAEECPREGGGNPTLAKFLEAKDMGLFRLLRVVVSRLSKWETGPCPVCKDQDPEHDVQECVRVARYSKENDQLVVRPRVPEPEPTAQERITGAYGPCHKCGDPLANHLVDDCQELEGENIGLRLMIMDTTRLGTEIERQVFEWNTYQIEMEEICLGCQQEIEEDHDVRACIQCTYVYADEVGKFGTKARTEEDNKACVVQKTKPHTHSTCDEMRKCFVGHLKKYHQKRRSQWQQWCKQRTAELVGVPCSKCGCFWRGHDPATCQNVGTFNNNLRFFLETLPPYCVEIAKRVMDQQPERSHRYEKSRCPICEWEEFHVWKECFRQAHFRETKMGEGLIKVRDGSHSEIVAYLEVTGQGEEVEITSSLPRCRYCNIKKPHHFWTECAFTKRFYIA